MELRRVLLLFAIVLGTAALVASLARPREDDGGSSQRVEQRDTATNGTPTATERPSGQTKTIKMRAGGRHDVRWLKPGEPAALVIAVDKPGQVSIPSLGLVQPAEPLTPARFDILVSEPSRHRIETVPAKSGQAVALIGTLRVARRQKALSGHTTDSSEH